tara:strand:- start:99 stop:536 length:438 start_codon:yes stop_codon:yes gene_type:complete
MIILMGKKMLMKVLRNVNLLLILFFSLSCTPPNQQEPTIERVDVDTFEAKLNTLNNAFLIDVRTPGEYKSGHINGSTNIDFNQVDHMKVAFEKLDHNQPMLIYCAAGGRSNKTRVLMAEMGFTQVYELSSGMSGWEAAGKPISLK